jgi:hypothetical protein
MPPEDQGTEKKQKLESLERELSDLRQGLCLVQDYYHDLEKVAKKQDAEENVDESLLKPLMKEDEEFEGIWKFHAEMLIPDPASAVPSTGMYESFVTYCTGKGRGPADRQSFEFVLLQMGMRLAEDRGAWQGCRLRTVRR